jgi:succinylglutamic semialdehyde dehydrogenase
MNPTLESVSPSDPSDVVARFEVADAAAVSAAVARAREAFPRWRDAGADARAAVLERFARAVDERAAELTLLIAREVGKARWDAQAEARLLAPKIAVTLAEGMALVKAFEPAPGQRATYRPRGVLAVYGPFNFPAHLPNGHIAPALATGNTVVFKPSEIAPAVGAWMAARWHDAGLPEGVLEVVQGGPTTGRALAAADVDGILFTGSYGTGRALLEATLDAPQKILALELGGSNAMIVCADADLDLAVSEAALSIAATTGQRCTAVRRIFVERSLREAFQDKLAAVLAGLRVGAPLDEGVFMGPLASLAGHARLEGQRSLASAAGGERVLLVDTGRPPPYTGAGLVRFESTAQRHAYQREEIFGPEAALYPVADLDCAIAAANDADYGLAASVMTRDRAHYEYCIGRVRSGILNWNRGTIGASGRLPFGGGGRSGNDRPAGILSTVYCATPQSHLEYAGGLDPASLPPGMPQP